MGEAEYNGRNGSSDATDKLWLEGGGSRISLFVGNGNEQTNEQTEQEQPIHGEQRFQGR